MATEINQNLYKIRNSFFHYNSKRKNGEDTPSCENMKQLFVAECKSYKKLILQIYASNNVLTHFDQNAVFALINEIYGNDKVKGSYIPSFKNVLHFNTHRVGDADEIRLASYFLYKELYYGVFCFKNLDCLK